MDIGESKNSGSQAVLRCYYCEYFAIFFSKLFLCVGPKNTQLGLCVGDAEGTLLPPQSAALMGASCRRASATLSCRTCPLFPILLLQIRPQNTCASSPHLGLLLRHKASKVDGGVFPLSIRLDRGSVSCCLVAPLLPDPSCLCAEQSLCPCSDLNPLGPCSVHRRVVRLLSSRKPLVSH